MQEVDQFVHAAMTSGHITSEKDVKILSEYPQKVKNMIQHLHLHTTMEASHAAQLLFDMDQMLESDLPIVNELNELNIPDVMDALKQFEE